MKNRGVSGFAIIVLILVLLIIGYAAYQIGRVHFTHGTIGGKVENLAKVGSTMGEYDVIDQLIKDVREAKVELPPDSIIIDRSIPDSFRIYVAYDDSSDIFGLFTYRRHLRVDKVVSVKIRF